MTRRNKILFITAMLLCFAVAIVFGWPDLTLVQDKELNVLLTGTLCRIGLTAFLVVLIVFYNQTYLLRFPKRTFARSLAWCIPCFLVAVVNFSFSALITHTAEVTRPELLPLFLFAMRCYRQYGRAFIPRDHARLLPKKAGKHQARASPFRARLLGNLRVVASRQSLFRRGCRRDLLQVGYSFLIDAMLAVTFDKTKNIWLCVFLHALFDVGGTMIAYIGVGDPQDLVFWILTVVVGVLCAVHILLTALYIDKRNSANAGQD